MTVTTRLLSRLNQVRFDLGNKGYVFTCEGAEGFLTAISSVHKQASLQFTNLSVSSSSVGQTEISGQIHHNLSLWNTKGPLTVDQIFRMMESRHRDIPDPDRFWSAWTASLERISTEPKPALLSKASAD